MMKRSTYKRVELVSKIVTLHIWWGCVAVALWTHRYWLIPVGLVPYLFFHNQFICGVVYRRVDELSQTDSQKG
jgi:hypothetical protein